MWSLSRMLLLLMLMIMCREWMIGQLRGASRGFFHSGCPTHVVKIAFQVRGDGGLHMYVHAFPRRRGHHVSLVSMTPAATLSDPRCKSHHSIGMAWETLLSSKMSVWPNVATCLKRNGVAVACVVHESHYLECDRHFLLLLRRVFAPSCQDGGRMATTIMRMRRIRTMVRESWTGPIHPLVLHQTVHVHP